MNILRRLLILSLFCALIAPPIEGALVEDNIAFINIQKLITFYSENKNLTAEIDKLKNNLLDQGKDKIEKIEALKIRLSNLEKELSGEKSDSDIKRLQNLREELLFLEDETSAWIASRKSIIDATELKMKADILKTISAEITKYSEKKRYTLIIDINEGILYWNPELDITNELIKRLKRVRTRETTD